MTQFGSSDGSSQGAVPDAQGPDMEWDLDVDAFLDDYLKELGPEAQAPDHFGNIAIDFAPTAAQPGLLGPWGAAAPASSLPVDSSAQQAPTMLTGQLQAHGLHQQHIVPTAHQQQQQSQQQQNSQEHQQQRSQPPARATRARKSAAGAATATAAAAAAAGGASSLGGGGVSRATSTGGSRGSRETKKEHDLKKHLALQEKNRRAQRRFRERQKQRVSELEEQVAALQAQLEAAASGRGGAAAAAAPAGVAAGSAGGSPVVAGGDKSVRLAPSEGDLMQHDCKQEAVTSPRAVVGGQRPSSSAPASDKEPAVLGFGLPFDDALTLTVMEGHPVQLSARELADMTPAELAKYYKAYVNELAGILVESDNPASHATQERVRRLVDEVCLLSTRAALCNPPGSKHFALTKVDDVPGQPADARVPQIARALDISQHQRKQLGQLRSLFLQKLGRIAGDRRDINAQLAGSVPGGTGNRHLCSRYLAAHDSARRLRESLREEHILVLDFISTIYKHVFTSQQVAQFMIQSYPWTPDCLALCTWVAAEDGDAEALGMLAADAQSKQQAAHAVAAAAASGGAPGVPQASSGCSGGSGTSLAGAAMGVPTPGASMGLPCAPGAAMFMPTSFAGMQPGGQAMYGQPLMAMGGGGSHHQGMMMAAGFNPAAALMHAPNGTDGMAGMMMGQRWPPAAAGSGAQSAMQQPQQLMTHAGSGCLPISLRLPHLTELAPGGASMGMPLSPHVVTMSSAATNM